MASASDSTRTPSLGHPAHQALAAIGEKNYAAAIGRMLSADARQELLSTLSISGLCCLFQAHDAASLAFTHEANKPCADDDEVSTKLLDELADHHHRGLEAVIAELERREPSDSSDRALRFKLLTAWYTGCEDWSAVVRLASQAVAGQP